MARWPASGLNRTQIRSIPRSTLRIAYVFGAIYPCRGAASRLVLPSANAGMMNLHLTETSTTVTPGANARLTVDGAG